MTDGDIATRFIEQLAHISHNRYPMLWAGYCELSSLLDFKDDKYAIQLEALGKLIREAANVPVN